MTRQFYDGYPKKYEKINFEKCEESKKSPNPTYFPDAECGNHPKKCGIDSFFDRIAIDDAILLGIALLLLHDGTDDTLLLVIIGVLFFSGLT